MTAHLPEPSHEPAPGLCAHCGREVPVMDALVYHGIVYHPTCVFPGGIAPSPWNPESDPTPNPSPSASGE